MTYQRIATPQELQADAERVADQFVATRTPQQIQMDVEDGMLTSDAADARDAGQRAFFPNGFVDADARNAAAYWRMHFSNAVRAAAEAGRLAALKNKRRG